MWNRLSHNNSRKIEISPSLFQEDEDHKVNDVNFFQRKFSCVRYCNHSGNRSFVVLIVLPIFVFFLFGGRNDSSYDVKEYSIENLLEHSVIHHRSHNNNNNKARASNNDFIQQGTQNDAPVESNVNLEKDKDCPFRNYSIYRKIYVYPNHFDVENGWKGNILSKAGRDPSLPRWPFLDYDVKARKKATGHYNIYGQTVQYTTELLVREIMINPKSCLRTYDPEEATLFYVPYLPSIEHHMGTDWDFNYNRSVYGDAIMDILEQGRYKRWENTFGLTSKYWKRRGGSDHILVFSEPMHGLYHPRWKRGNFHFIHSQKQLKPPIVISVELSTTFVRMHPKCAAKNILVPYPNTDGRWFNGEWNKQTLDLIQKNNLTLFNSPAALAAERELAKARRVSSDSSRDLVEPPRLMAQFFSVGNHGTCKKLRMAMTSDYKCSASGKLVGQIPAAYQFPLGTRLSTFCPCPGGDSPSAKRHYDSLFAKCIPIILSYDFVWPFTNEFNSDIKLDPSEFSLRLNAQRYTKGVYGGECRLLNSSQLSLQGYLETISSEELHRLRQGVEKVRKLYAWYRFVDSPREMPENPLREGILPDGGAAHQVVQMLAERAAGAMWPACEEELKQQVGSNADDKVREFKC